MACGATLKRSHDLDYLLSPTSKSPGRNCPAYCTPPAKKSRKSLPIKEPSSDKLALNKLVNSTGSPQSPFKKASTAVKLQPEHVLKNIYDEYKKIKHRKKLITSQSDVKEIPSGSNSENASISQAITACVSSKKSEHDIPLLTIKQVGLICERLLKDQEEKLSNEYENVLVQKLSEQYDAFVKFNYDQIQRRISEQPASYVS